MIEEGRKEGRKEGGKEGRKEERKEGNPLVGAHNGSGNGVTL